MRHYYLQQDLGIIYMKWVGEITTTDRLNNLEFLLKECETHNIDKVIVDVSEQYSTESFGAEYKFGRKIRRSTQHLKLAVIQPGSSINIEFLRLIVEPVLKNTLRFFRDKIEAERWLIGQTLNQNSITSPSATTYSFPS